MKKNFTFAELVVVLSCLSMLAVLALGMSDRNPKTIACQSALARISEGVQAYAFDFNEYLPQSVNYSYHGKNPGHLPQQWLVSLQYVPLETMRDGCPDYPVDKPKFYKICGYAYNAYLGRYNKDGELKDANPMWYKNFPATKISRLKDPAKKFLMSDTLNYLWLAYISDSVYNDWRHENGSNFLYFDGQVKRHGKDEFKFTPEAWDKLDRSEIAARLWPQ